MLRNGLNTVNSIKAKVMEEHGFEPTTDQVLKMASVPKNSSSDYEILSLQYGDLTILCWMAKETGLCHRCKTVSW